MSLNTLKTPLIIGINGGIGSGKDEVGKLISKSVRADQFHTSHTYIEVYRKSFAEKLKKMISLQFDLPLHCVDQLSYTNKVWDFTREQKATKLTPYYNHTLGEVLQQFATEVVRNNWDKDFWIKGVQSSIDNQYNPDNPLEAPTVFIITDLRFENEFQWIKQKGGLNVYVDRPDNNVKDNRSTTHQSETDLSSHINLFDFVIENDSTLEDLQLKVSPITKVISNYFTQDVN